MRKARAELRSEPSFADMLHIAQNLRERDREELFATTYGNDPATIARDAVNAGAFRWGAYYDGKPVAAFGAFPRWPNVWTGWAYGTNDFKKVSVLITRHVRRFMLPALYNSGAIRVDAMALASHTDASKWLEYLGAEREFELDRWGKDGQTFVNYVWTREATKRIIDHPSGVRS